uniref:Decapping nuclease n=1 Tax=Parascaris univalens TaxID=6257 RepID=A0A915AMY9_PARUN
MEVIQSLLTIEQPTKGDDTNAMDVSEPITIGQFAQTNRSTIHLGLNALRYLDEWIVGATSHSYDTNQINVGIPPVPLVERKLDFILQWIYHTSASRSTLAAQGIDFVCWETVLRRIAATPFFENMAWGFPVVKLRGVHFFDDTNAIDDATGDEPLMRNLSMKFKQYVTSDAPLREGNQRANIQEGSPLMRNLVQQCIVTQRSIDGLGLLYGTDVDCIGEDGKFVQLKTNPLGVELKTSQLMEWWIKAYLNGFGRTLVGHIDKDGFIVEITRLQTGDMLKEAQESNESAAVSFLSAVLHEVKRRLDGGKELEQYMVEYSPQAKTVSIRKLEKAQRIRMLPDYFAHQFH